MRIALALLACLLTIWAVQVFAKPAPWYLWESRVDHNRICLQYPPGKGWVLASGPYSDGRCTRRTAQTGGLFKVPPAATKMH